MRTAVRRTWILTAVAAVTMSLVVPVASAAGVDSLTWGPCADAPAPLQCATLDVPLDYRKPGGPAIKVAVSKLASTKPSQRRGVLLMNPGGPGGPGLTMPLSYVQLGVPASLLDSYDLIGFDPRGVGESTPVTCDLTPEQIQSNVPPYARDAADVTSRAAYVKAIAQQCGASKTASLLPYITTANTARDMDRIREALGEKKISYYGISYGTYLGAVYSTLFPQQTDRVVLDSVVGPGGLDTTGARRFGQGFQDRFPDFAAWAAARNDTYGLGKTARAVTAKYFELAQRLDTTPSQGVSGALFRAATLGSLYQTEAFPTLAQQWQVLDRGEGAGASAMAAQPDFGNLLSSQLYIVCGDVAWPSSVETYQRNVAHDRVRYPMFGAAAANIWPCAFWPSRPQEAPVRIDDRGPSNILVVQNQRDPATPLVGARETRAALGDRARMVTVDQGGHGVFLVAPNACGTNAVTKFFVDGKRASRDTQCGREDRSLFSGLTADQQRQRADALKQVQPGIGSIGSW